MGSTQPHPVSLHLTLMEAQHAAVSTAQTVATGPTALAYLGLGLSGEAGEVANKIKKVFRDDGGWVTPERRDQLSDELGDVLWYTLVLINELNLNASQVFQNVMRKIHDRNCNE